MRHICVWCAHVCMYLKFWLHFGSYDTTKIYSVRCYCHGKYQNEQITCNILHITNTVAITVCRLLPVRVAHVYECFPYL